MKDFLPLVISIICITVPSYSTFIVQLLQSLTLSAQYGNPKGVPVIFLHGGPGGQTSPSNTAFFDPQHYRVVLLDQRGSGKSEPAAELRENTSQLLVQDIETLREHVGIEKWGMVFGGKHNDAWVETARVCDVC
jgi:proline iminopeptidase